MQYTKGVLEEHLTGDRNAKKDCQWWEIGKREGHSKALE